MLINQEYVPFKALNYLIATINYGGRITDKNDEKLIVSLLEKFLNDQVIDQSEEYCFMGNK